MVRSRLKGQYENPFHVLKKVRNIFETLLGLEGPDKGGK